MSLFVVVEGRGDQDAVPVLIAKLAEWAHVVSLPHIPRGGVASIQLHLNMPRGQERLQKLREAYRVRPGVSALLVTQDSEDACPRDVTPDFAGWVRELGLAFPVAVVLFYREYETLFLAASHSLQGRRLRGPVERPGLPPGAIFAGDPEGPRDAKGWVGRQLGRRYLETIDQSAFTRTMDLADEGLSRLSSFRRLRCGLEFLGDHAGTGQRGMVYL